MPNAPLPENVVLGGLLKTPEQLGATPTLKEAGDRLVEPLQPLLVVLDLDHTLVCSRDQVADGYDFHFAHGSQEGWVWKRPGLDAFLAWLRRPGVEVAAYTAASSAYAQSVVDVLDPEGSLFKWRLSRRHCVLEPPAKDLTRFGHDLGRTVLVDDSPASFRLQPDNGLLVKPFRHTDSGDTELRRVAVVLEKLVGAPDVRQLLRGARPATVIPVARPLRAEAPQAVIVSGAGHPAVDGRYVQRRGPLRGGRPVYVNEERPCYRILWSERNGSWVVDDGEAKEYRYAAVGCWDADVPLGALWSSCGDNSPQPLLRVAKVQDFGASVPFEAAPRLADLAGNNCQAPFPAKRGERPPLAPLPLQAPLRADCNAWCGGLGGPRPLPSPHYEEANLSAVPWVSMAASAGA